MWRTASRAMSRKFLPGLALLCGGLILGAQPAAAQQTFNVSLGHFSVQGQDARVSGDVLNANRAFLDFNVNEMSGPAIGAEWLIPLGGHLEAGAGLSFTRRTIPTVYRNFVNTDGTEIEEQLRLRTLPLDFTFRVLPLGQRSGFQPYLGGGVGVVAWRYSESGDFVDFTDNSIFNHSYSASGTSTGPVALGGIRMAGQSMTAGFEVRYRRAKGALPEPFAGPTIDLGGWVYQLTLGMRFGK